MSKYKSIKSQLDGIEFDSKKERERYAELKLLQRAGRIKNLKLQPKYELQEKFNLNGKTYRAINYIADFEYYDNNLNKIIVEDVKSEFTRNNPIYKIKKKMFLKKYGEKLKFIEVV